jgi:hypothetical protein
MCSPRGKDHLVVALPNGQHRSVPHSAVTTEVGQEISTREVEQQELAVISVRTLLPLAYLVQVKLKATREVPREATLSQERQASSQPVSTTRPTTPTATSPVPSQTPSAQSVEDSNESLSS